MAFDNVRELISASEIQAKVAELGKKVTLDYAQADPIVVGVLKGCFVFMADLCRHIDLPISCDFLGVSSYGDRTRSSGVARITSDLSLPIEGRDVLLVEDIVDTGLTMQYLIENLKTRKPSSIKVCSLLEKPSRAIVPISIDYLGFTIDDVFVVGYGMDYQNRYRNLSYLGEVKSIA